MKPAVVVITRNRVREVVRTVGHLRDLGEAELIVVVDNGSGDGTADIIARTFPDVTLVRLPRNVGSAARNIGVRSVRAPYVAFSDDDTLWEPGAITKAAELLDRYPTVAVVAARMIVGAEGEPDAACEEMAESPLASHADLPGPRLLGFQAGAAVVRRVAFEAVGGFHPAMMIGGEEQLLACDLSRAGWHVVYCADLVTRHLPSPQRSHSRRRRLVSRNALWFAWLRRPRRAALRTTLQVCGRALHDPPTIAGVADAARGARWVWRERSVVPEWLEAEYDLLDRAG